METAVFPELEILTGQETRSQLQYIRQQGGLQAAYADQHTQRTLLRPFPSCQEQEYQTAKRAEAVFVTSMSQEEEKMFLFPSVPTTLCTKRWRRIFTTIYSCRAIFSLIVSGKERERLLSELLPCRSFTAIRVDSYPEEGEDDDAITEKSLGKIVKERDLDRLIRWGGSAGLIVSLGTDVVDGIRGGCQEFIERRQIYGSNTYAKPRPKGLLYFVLEAFKDKVILVLLACAVLSIVFGIKEDGLKEGWYDGGSISVAVALVILVSAASNFRQSKQFDSLSRQSEDIRVDVVRDGRRQQVSIFDIVVGDVVCLTIGNQIPADGLVLEGHSLQIDESSMTGESDPVNVDPVRSPFLVSGSKVSDGYGRMLVTAVGMNTTWGEMMSSISCDLKEDTPLQARLEKLTSYVGVVGLVVAGMVLVVLVVRYFMGATKDDNGRREFQAGQTKLDEVMNAIARALAAAITIVVVAIPEGLPLAVTLTLAYSMKRMMADQAMVRTLAACETMGSATVICTDKTGTLTENLMKVTKFSLGGAEGLDSSTPANSKVLELIHQATGLNTTGSVYRQELHSPPEFSGSPTEKAILSWAVTDLGMDLDEVKQNYTILSVETFNSEKKRSGIAARNNADGSCHFHWKGAAEMILNMCSQSIGVEGNLEDMDRKKRETIEKVIQGMASQSLRCIAFAYKRISEQEAKEVTNVPEDGFTLLLLLGLKDPCRPGVKHAVEACRSAGVSIKMITGDNVFTAAAIAAECGILTRDDNFHGAIVEGKDFRNYTFAERLEKVGVIRVMARSSPMDKLLMVQCLREKGEVVAVTGDGTNDAPALKEADVGLSMGIQGTEVAKQSSDIVILDDNFATVVTVLSWGRCVYNNIQKFIQFQLTVNLAALVINFVAAVSSGHVPLTAVQLLWVNLIMDTLGALALATERPATELMEKNPVGRTQPLITSIMWRNMIPQALYQVVVLLILQFKGREIFHVNEQVRDTLIFNTFVFCQVFNEFNARKLEKKNVLKGIHKNKLFLAIVGVTVVLQVLMVEFMRKFADTERLGWGQWGASIGIAAISWPLALLVKMVPVPDENPSFNKTNMSKA